MIQSVKGSDKERDKREQASSECQENQNLEKKQDGCGGHQFMEKWMLASLWAGVDERANFNDLVAILLRDHMIVFILFKADCFPVMATTKKTNGLLIFIHDIAYGL